MTSMPFVPYGKFSKESEASHQRYGTPSLRNLEVNLEATIFVCFILNPDIPHYPVKVCSCYGSDSDIQDSVQIAVVENRGA